MSKFIPEPVYDETWWKTRNLINAIGFDNEMCIFEEVEIKPEQWIACGVLTSEIYAPIEGYQVVFPTATDCLYWIRWVLLPFDCDLDQICDLEKIELFGTTKEIAQKFDESKDGTKTEYMLKEILDILDLPAYFQDGNLDLYYIKSGEQYIREENE